MIIPSIDIMEGKAVQLKKGKEKVIEREDVIDLAQQYSLFGEIAVIDLDSALGKGDNIELIKKLCSIANCRVGGGIRTIEKANQILSAGAKKIIIGTKAEPEFLKQLPKDRLIIAVDAKEGYVYNKGWTNNTGNKVIDVIKKLEDYCSGFLFTDIDYEGMMKGIDIDEIKKIKKATTKRITFAGGIASLDDIKSIEELNSDSQIGMSLYSNKISMIDAFISVLDFKKNNNLIPTIVQDKKGQVLMMAYSSKASLKKALEERKGAYYSRSRNKLWRKGETSGNYQKLIKARYDCDKDTLLFIVEQKNNACHLGDYSCFGDKEFKIQELYEVVSQRIRNPMPDSYTSKIGNDESKIKEKIKEESKEVIEYKDRDNLIWEIADLTYFIIMLMAKKGITINEVENELWRRRK